jgi:hypothetical protein
MQNIRTKLCYNCKKTKNLGYFSYSKDSKDLRSSICSDCSKLLSQNYTQKMTEINTQKQKANILNQPALNKQCRTCKTIYPMTHDHFYYALGKSDGFDSVCIPCTKLRQKQPDRIYNFIKTQAKQKNRLFTITKEQHKTLALQPCFYCQGKSDGWLDRKYSKFDYTIDNVVSSCSICNKMKRAQDSDDFINLCKKIASKH